MNTKVEEALASLAMTAAAVGFHNAPRRTKADEARWAGRITEARTTLAAHLAQQDATIVRLEMRLAEQNAAGFAWNGHMVHGDKDSVHALIATLGEIK